MTHKSFQLHFKTLQTKYKRFEVVIFSTGTFVRSNTYKSPSPVVTGHLLQSDCSKCPAATGDGAFATHCRMALKYKI